MRPIIAGILLMLVMTSAAQAQTGRRLAIGGDLKLSRYADGDLGSRSPGIGFISRIRRNAYHDDGWAWEPQTSLSMTNVDAQMNVGGAPALVGRLRTVPALAGIQRGYRHGPMKVGAWVVAGPSFNHLEMDGTARSVFLARTGGTLESVRARNSIAVKPGITGWYDLNDRFAVHGTISYSFNRPTVETTVDGVTTFSKWKTDHASAGLGLAVGIF